MYFYIDFNLICVIIMYVLRGIIMNEFEIETVINNKLIVCKIKYIKYALVELYKRIINNNESSYLAYIISQIIEQVVRVAIILLGSFLAIKVFTVSFFFTSIFISFIIGSIINICSDSKI